MASKAKQQVDVDNLRISHLQALRRVSEEYSHLGRDYIISHVTSDTALFYSPSMRRFDGYTIIIAVKGTIKMTINLETVEVPPMSVVFVAPDRVFNPISYEGDELDVYLLFLSNKFVYDINIDLKAVDTNIFTSIHSVLTLTTEKISTLLRYFDMLHSTAGNTGSYNRYIAQSLLAAAAYQIMAYCEETASARESDAPTAHSRKLTYVRNFLRLVKANHRVHRAIAFYADRMCISPKYLSLIIKEATGKSAAQWIDEYVIQEAKNLLRYSGKNVQQIAYELNFNNQSAFGKYFKNLTGLSPTQFQNH